MITYSMSPDRESILHVLNNPRWIEEQSNLTAGMSVDQVADMIMGAEESWAAYADGVPIAIWAIRLFQHPDVPSHLEALYGVWATPVINKHIHTYTRRAKCFVETAMRDYQNHRHIVMTYPNSIMHRWLNLIGFCDTNIRVEFPSASLMVLEA